MDIHLEETMKRLSIALAVVLIAVSAFGAPPRRQVTPPAAPAMPDLDIPYQKVVLDNGLTVIVHEDHKAPIVAVNVWYHVGSKNEPAGRSGFAHLFEHLMFNGSENYNHDYFNVLERVGATDLNGTTNEDRTNYFQNVPTSAVDLALWMESDRMGHLLGAIDQAKLDEQRGVVQNEKRQGDNQPYAVTEELITKAVWPAAHPYSHTVIGSMEDLDAAKLDDVKEWFKTYYGPSNATLVIAGDITTDKAVDLAKKYFGDIPPGPPVAHFDAWVAKRSGEERQRVEDRVPQARLYMVWNIPGWGTEDGDYLDLLSDVLSLGKSSRLYKRLVYDEQSATDVRAYIDRREIASLFTIRVTVKPGGDLASVEKAVREELDRILTGGPTSEEVDRVRTQYIANFTRGVERIGGFGGKSDILAQSQVYGGSPDAWKTTLDRVKKVTAADLHRVAKQWLSDGDYLLEVVPYPNYKADAKGADRSKLPEAGTPPEPKFPKLERATLSNGMKLVVAQRKSVPVVDFRLVFDAGYASDQFAVPGTASLAMNMLDEGTAKRNALEISDDLATLGARLSTGSNLDQSFVSLSALKSNLGPSLDLFADVVLNPSFPQADFERLQKQQMASISREKANPIQMALRVFPILLYGKGHAYGLPFTGSGYEDTVAKLTRDDLVKFHDTWFRPNNATLEIVGDTSLAEIQPMIEKLFDGWKRADVPKKNISTVSLSPKPVVYLIDKPGAQQSVILAGHVAPPKANPDEVAIETMNTVLGGAFISRINMNLREDKHWTYGAGSFLVDAEGQRPFIAYAPVQTDKTKESIVELQKELADVTSTRPVTKDELDMAQSNLTLALPGDWETNGEVMGAINDLVRFGLPDDYWSTYASKVRATSLADMKKAAKEVVHPGSIVWVIVGDLAKVEDGIRSLNIGAVHRLDADGNTID